MNKKIIKEWLSDIATPTGISYSGDRTISESMAEKIVDYVSNLEQTLDESEKYIKNHKRKSETRIYGLEIPEFIFYGEIEDIEKIIQKAKGDVKNENKNN